MRADNTIGDAVLATVSLADLSGLPIGLDRLHSSLIGTPLSLLETSMAADELVAQGSLVRRDDLVCLAGHEAVFDFYVDATQRAVETWPLAEAWAKRVGQVPFVRMVAVVGGLAVDALGPDDAIDLFIVVRPRRLWTTRLLVCKVLRSAAREGVDLVPVYFTTTRAPEIRDHSIPIAWELAQLAVVVGEHVGRTMRRSNDWIFELLPNAEVEGNLDHHVDHEPSSAQKWKESLLLLPPFRLVENWTRQRQTAQLRRVAHQDSTSGTLRHRERFSTEVCDEHLGVRAALTERAWNATIDKG